MSATRDAIAPSARAADSLRAYAVIIAIAIVAAHVLPRSAAIWLAMIAGVLIAMSPSSLRLSEARAISPLAAVMAAFCAYAFVNSLWAVDPLDALGKVASLSLIVATVHLAVLSARSLRPEQWTVIGRAIAIAVCFGVGFLAFEVVSDQLIMRTIFDLLPFLRGSPKHVKIAADGSVDRIGLYVLNRNLAALNLMLWPALALVTALIDWRRAAIVAAVALILTAIAVYGSEHETSMLALPAALLAFAVAKVSSRWATRMLVVGWVAATLLIVPLTMAAYSSNLHFAKWIPETGRNRIILWSYTVDQWRKAPILGIGVASTKELDDKNGPTAVKPDGFTYPLRIGRHAHNIYLQTWYELGAVGALLLLAMGLAALRAISGMAERAKPFALAGFASAAVLAAFSWGLWQVWFLALFGISALLAGLVSHVARD